MLHLKNISLKLGTFSLKNISMDVKKGEYLVILGPTGTGKTVLMETIAGLHRPDTGSIFLNNREVTCLPPENRNIGMVYQDYALFPHLTVYANIAFGLKLMGKKSKQIEKIISKAAALFGIKPILNRKPRYLSGGECQRTALARALVLNPHILLLDEPLSALDRFTKDRLRRELKRIHKKVGVSILHITHDLSEAFFLADRLIIMKDGLIIQEDTPENALNRPKNRFVAELLGIENFILVRVEKGMAIINGFGSADIFVQVPEYFRDAESLYLTVPAWGIDLFPKRKKDLYLFTGKMQITGINQTESHIEVKLGHGSGVVFRTSISRREAGLLPVSLEPGLQVKTGLLRDSIHWVEKHGITSAN